MVHEGVHHRGCSFFVSLFVYVGKERQMIINGRGGGLAQPVTLRELLRERGYALERIVVERNGGIVPPEDYATTWVQDGDRLEIVSFVGGG